MPDKKKSTVRKTFIRNVEIPMTKHKIHGWALSNSPIQIGKTTNLATKKNASDTSLSMPILNSALKLEQRVTQLQKPQKQMLAQNQAKKILSGLNQKIAAIAREKLTHQMNFGLQQKVFKNLVPAHVNDSVIEAQHRKPPRPIARSTNKPDPVPNLSDYVEPLRPLDCKMSLSFAPETFQKSNTDLASEILYELFALEQID